MKHSDVLLIGAGISSLTAALLLAKKGKRVTILEQHSKPGGYLHCFQRFGERFDTGAHYVGAMDVGDPFHTLLNYLGVYRDDLFVPLDPTGFDVLNFPEFTARLPKGYGETIRALGELFPSESQAIQKYFSLIQHATTYFPTYRFDDVFNEVPAGEIFETSLASVVESLTSNEKLQSVLYAYCTLHGVSPQDVAFGFHAIVVDSLVRGAYGLKAGGDGLANSFVQSLKSMGGEIYLKTTVQKLRVVDRVVLAVETTEGEEFSADWIVSGVHPKTTFALVDDKETFSTLFKQRMQTLTESTGLFGISALCKADLSPLRNYYYFSSSDPRRLMQAGLPSEPPSVVFLSPSRREAIKDRALPINLHSPGPMEWFAQWERTSWGRRGDDYVHLKAQIAKNAFSLVEKYMPGFSDSISKFATSTPLTNLHFNGNVSGSAYGLYHSIQNTGPRAIGPRTKVLNLLLTGQSCLFPGLLGAAISGLRSAGHIIGIKPILADLKRLGEQA